jgi:hypothetical protein
LGCPTPLMMRRHARYSIFLLNAIHHSKSPKEKVVVKGQEGMANWPPFWFSSLKWHCKKH